MKRSASDAQLVAHGETKSSTSSGIRLPLLLHLSPRIPADQQAELRVLVSSKPQYACFAESEEKALLVLPDFQQEELAALEKRKRRVVGLPFVLRFLQDPGLLSKVPALPLYDLIYRCPGALCFSAMEPWQRTRSQTLAKWMGARCAQDVASGTELLVAARVSIHPDSKYQEALARRIPIVKPSYLEAVWETKRLVDVQLHHLLPLAGLAICFDADCCGDSQGPTTLKDGAVASGGQIVPFDKAEVVIVADTSRSLYKEARKRGQQVAPPKWLERCLQIRCALQISGDLEVPQPGAVSGSSPASMESNCTTMLERCVLCLLYLEAGSREAARAWAWRCGAWTTLDPLDPAITHVLFNVLLDAAVVVSVPTDKEIYFLDVSWLEACASGNKALETDFPRQQVSYNPTCDTIYSTAMGNVREISRGLRRVRSTGAEDVADPSLTAALAGRPLSRASSDPPPVVPAPVADMEPHISPPLSEGIFTGLVLGMAGWPHDMEAQIVEQICTNGGSAAHGIGSNINALMTGKPNMCLCWGNGPPVFATPAQVPLVTVQWLQACIAEQTLHPSSAFPHFEPGKHPMPLSSMSKFVIRITGLQQDRKSSRERWRLEELVQVLGAAVAQQNTRRSELTHIVCAEPSLLQSSFAELAAKRQIPLVSVQWLLDSFRLGSLQPDGKYGISGISGISSSSDVSASATGGPVACFTAVLAKCDILLSKTTLANTPDLHKMAKDLAAASVEIWKTADELRNCLQARREGQAIIVVDKDEAHRNGLESIAANLSERQSFVQPSWLSETYSQRRRLPVESFGVFVTEDVQEPRPAQGASYAWQPAEMKRLEEVSEQAHQEKESKTGGSINLLSAIQASAEQQARRDKESKAGGSINLLSALKAGAEQKLAKLGS